MFDRAAECHVDRLSTFTTLQEAIMAAVGAAGLAGAGVAVADIAGASLAGTAIRAAQTFANAKKSGEEAASRLV